MQDAVEYLKNAFIKLQKEEDSDSNFALCYDLNFFEPYFEMVQSEELFNYYSGTTTKRIFRVGNRYISIIHHLDDGLNKYDFDSVKFATKKTITIDVYD